MVMIDDGLKRRFWSKVQKGAGCWLWTAAKDRAGYGQFRAGGRGRTMARAHRVSWSIHYGDIPAGMNCLHKCDNPSCVRPDHLFLGTLSDNNHDMAVKGRNAKGMANGRAKLTEKDVSQIRLMLHQGMPQRRIATRFGVSQTLISNIAAGKTWGHVE